MNVRDDGNVLSIWVGVSAEMNRGDIYRLDVRESVCIRAYVNSVAFVSGARQSRNWFFA